MVASVRFVYAVGKYFYLYWSSTTVKLISHPKIDRYSSQYTRESDLTLGEIYL